MKPIVILLQIEYFFILCMVIAALKKYRFTTLAVLDIYLDACTSKQGNLIGLGVSVYVYKKLN